jgi:flagellar hook-associated protein 1 FlgK
MLSLGLDIARSGLGANGEQSSVISRNIANAGNLLASRKIVNLVTAHGGSVVVSSITRATNEALTRSLQSSISYASSQSAIADATASLEATVNDPELDSSPAALIGKLRDQLQLYASTPDNRTIAATTVDSGRRLATALNEASTAVQAVRNQADADIKISVDSINELLAKFAAVNKEIVKGSTDGTDITDQLDARDELVRSLSQEIGVRSVSRANNDMTLYTDSGLTLFDTVARVVSFQPTTTMSPGATGNPVYVDGVPVTGAGAMMAVQSGRIAGLAVVRDDLTVSNQRQLDELARGLIEAFSESDQSAVPSLPDITGLFTYSGGPSIPPSGIAVSGLAASIRVNPNVDPTAGGDPSLLRDGSIGDPGNASYLYNDTGSAGFSGRLQALISQISAPRAFDPSSGFAATVSLESASAASVGWLEDVRQKANLDADYRTTLADRTRDALSRATGVNLDEEMTTLLDVERAYQTSTKILSVIDSMFQSLLNAT